MRKTYLIAIGLACSSLAVPALAATAPEFFQAIRNGDSARIRALSTDKSNLALADEKGATPLHYAAAFGDLE